MTQTISAEPARLMLLSNLGLLHPPEKTAKKEDVLQAIRQMGALQIDTINVVARSPYLVLFSRLGDYNPAWLDENLADGKLFEYWSHAACFLPIEDYPLYRRLMLDGGRGYFNPEWLVNHRTAADAVMEKVQAGPVRSADFKRPEGQKGTWWDWKEEKVALEYLHTMGVLMIKARKNFHRIYDLTERILPGWDDANASAYTEVVRQFTLRAVKILGAATLNWITDYFRLRKTVTRPVLEELTAEKLIQVVELENQKEPAYIHCDNLGLLDDALSGKLQPTYSTLLSPFDPLVWDRDRDRALFNFDYTIECYTPASKRVYGYFSLPILHRGWLVGRLDAKAHRPKGIFEVRSFHWQPEIEPTPQMRVEVQEAIQRCAGWHKTPEVVFNDPN